MRPLSRLSLLALLATGCAQSGTLATPVSPAPFAPLATSDIRAVRQAIRDRPETEALGFRVEVASLQIVSPAYEGEHVFVANTITRREATGPALAWGRVVGSARVSPRRKVVVWKARARAWPDR